MSETSTIRLSKVLKEFSIGIDHAIDFLAKKGIKLDKNPNAKITQEAYDLLQKEFQSDKQILKTAEEITIQKLKKDNVVIEAKPTAEIIREKEAEADDKLTRNLIKIKQEAADKGSPAASEKKRAKKAEETAPEPEVIKAKVEKSGPKIVDKIDLEALETPKKKAAAKKKKEEAEEAAAAAKAAVEEAPKKKTAAKKKKDEPAEVPAEPVAETPPAPAPVEEVPAAPEAPAAEAPETPPAAAPDEPAAPAQPDAPFRLDRNKLSGPTILGKINLPTPPVKKPAASSDDTDRNKRKRKRTEKKVNIESASQQIKGDDRGPRTGGGQGGPKGGKKFERPAPKAEPSEKEIQEQIRATLARLSGGGSKSKGSKHRKEKRANATSFRH